MQIGIAPIEEADLPAVGQFLNQNLNGRIPPEIWVRSLIHPWYSYHFRVSRATAGGVFCAIYSDKTIDGRRGTLQSI
jgi:hypothetical protein